MNMLWIILMLTMIKRKSDLFDDHHHNELEDIDVDDDKVEQVSQFRSLPTHPTTLSHANDDDDYDDDDANDDDDDANDDYDDNDGDDGDEDDDDNDNDDDDVVHCKISPHCSPHTRLLSN